MIEEGIRYIGPRHIIVNNNPTPVPFWEINKDLYKDKTVIILGGGPSLNELDVNLLKNTQFIVVNSACRKVSKFAIKDDILYFSDNSWNENWPNLTLSWPGIVVTSNRNTKARLGNLVNRLNINDLTNFMEVKSDYVQASSGHTAACLGVYLGSKKIILIGFECKFINGKSHGHDDYRMDDTGPFKNRFLPGWKGLSLRFKELGVQVINSTPDSEIKDFEYMDLEKAINHA